VPTESAAPLKVSASVLDDGARRVVIVSIDAVLLSDAAGRPCREEIARRCGTNIENVVLQYSHTHEGPDFSAAGDPLALALREQAGDCAQAALLDLAPTRIQLAAKTIDGLNINRRRREQAVDKTLSVVRFERDGRPLAIWFHFTAHPLTAMGCDSRWSADFPGYAIAALKRSHLGIHAQFLQGAGGDVGPLDWWMGNTAPEFPTHDDTARRMGEKLAAEVEALLPTSMAIAGEKISVQQRSVALDHRKFWFTEGEVRELINETALRLEQNPPDPWGSRLHVSTVAQSESDVYMLCGARCILAMFPNQHKTIPCELQVIRIGSLTLATNPGELFSELATEIRNDNRSGPTLVMSYCNDSISYIPARRDLEELHGLPFREWIDQPKYRWAYGATITTRVAENAGENIVRITSEMLNA
jgi:hypothetical protein